MGNNIIFRDFDPVDRSKVFALLSSFYANIDSEKSWEDLYLNNPDGAAIISVAEKEAPPKNIIGHYSVIKTPMIIFKKRYPAGKGEGEIFDLSAMKELLQDKSRKKPYSTDLLKHTLDSALREGIKLVCTNPSDLALRSHLDSGFKIIKQKLDIFIFVFKGRYLAHLLSGKRESGWISNTAGALLAFVYNILYRINIFLYRKAPVTIEPLMSFDNRTDALSEAFHKGLECIAIERKQKHLNWRFGSGCYSKFLIKFNREDIGYAVLHIFRNPNGFKEANIVDFLILPSRWGNLSAAIMELLKIAKDNNCDFLRINYMYDIKEIFGVSRVLKRMNFINREDKRNIVVFLSPELAPIEKDILDVNKWYFTDLYFENY